MAEIKILGEYIRELRAKKGWTQEMLADLLNVNVVSVNRWENEGTTASPTSTAYLVLLPLILGAGVVVDVPTEPHDALRSAVSSLNLPSGQYRKLTNALIFASQLKTSRALFVELQQAFREIDKEAGALGSAPSEKAAPARDYVAPLDRTKISKRMKRPT